MDARWQDLVERALGSVALAAEPVAAEGSKRRMARLRLGDARTVIGVLGPDRAENRAFVAFARDLKRARVPVPEVLAVAPDESAYLVEDLGDRTLFQALLAARREVADASLPTTIRPAYERTLEALVRMQVDGGAAVDYGAAYPTAAFDATAIRWDLDAFKYQFLKLGGVPFHEARLEQDLRTLVDHLVETEGSWFVARDFQSRNVMLREGDQPWFIDFQNGRRGALAYDVASLLYDGKAALDPTTRASLFEVYLSALGERLPDAVDDVRRHFGGFALVRVLQAMSAYGYLGFFHRKEHFLQSVPHAVRNLVWLRRNEPLLQRLPELSGIIGYLAEEPRFAGLPAAPTGLATGLVVHVGSFSYRHGLPHDPTGHGGGFVFDCRALPNPGRSTTFAALCGLDRAVDRHLAELPEAGSFVEGALELVRRQVEAYRARSFTSLAVWFGCTGGQHRSVWCAERLAAALTALGHDDVEVRVEHRERPRWPATAGLDTASGRTG
ncbi:MAG: RNase adapter RapZ [Planctomycetota bacterium]